MWARRNRILAIGAILTVLLLATVLLQSPVPTKTVDEVLLSPQNFVGHEIAVRGEVRDGSIDNESMVFTLEGASSILRVNFAGASVSNGLDDNRTVYAEGKLVFDGEDYTLQANIIKTSCPSKYEEASTQE